MTRSTPENVIKYEMAFKMSEVNSLGGGSVTIETENGLVIGTLESLSTVAPLN